MKRDSLPWLIVGVEQSYNDGLPSGKSEKGVAAKSIELGVSAFLT